MIFQAFFRPVTKRYVERRVLKTHPKHLYRIIQDVNSYSKFLPLCSHSQVLRTFDDGKSFDATLTVGLPFGPGLQESYVSRVRLYPENYIVETKSIESKLFDSLQSRWKLGEIRSDDNMHACDVEFEVQMTVSDPLVAQVLDKVLEEVAGRQVEAFEKRCRQLPLPPDLQIKGQ